MSLITRTFKIKIQVQPALEARLDEQSRIVNGVRNYCVAKSREWRAEYAAACEAGDQAKSKAIAKKLYAKYSYRNLIPELRQERPWLNKVHSSPLQDAGMRVAEGVKRYVSWKKTGNGPVMQWPKFHKWSNNNWCSLYYNGTTNGKLKGIKLIGRNLRISLGGRNNYVYATLAEPAPFGTTPIKTARIIKQYGTFYVCFTIDPEPVASSKPVIRTVALDPNVKNLSYAVSCDGVAIEIQWPTILRKLSDSINQLTSQRDKCKAGSQKSNQLNKKLNKLRHKRQEIKKQAFYTIAHRLCKEFDCIVIGDWTAKGGINRGMRRVINNETALSEFREILAWVAKRAGKDFAKVSERNTTKTCHVCGHTYDGGIDPKIRQWACPNSSCNTVHIRDENAAINILRRFTIGHLSPGLGHHSITERCTWRVGASGIYVTHATPANRLNQERSSS